MTSRAGDQRSARSIATATERRLLTAAEALGIDTAALDGAGALAAIVERLVEGAEARIAWLLLTVVAGRYPLADDVRALRRAARLGDATEVTLAALDRALPLAARSGTADRAMRLVADGVLVDLDACARSDFHNGIQRVARETTTAWAARRPVTVVAWTDDGAVTRTMTRREEARAAHWSARNEELSAVLDDGTDQPRATSATDIVVPWGGTLVLAEVPLGSRCPALAALAEFSGTEVVAIGYDAIPLVTADLRPFGEPDAFTAYLTVIKHAARVAGISRSATTEFAGFVHALGSQGLAGPEVSEIALPLDVPPPPPDFRRTEPAQPRIVAVGRLEPHKNHVTLLHAAELLWREGLQFDLDLIGGAGWSMDEAVALLDQLRAARRPVRRLTGVPDGELWSRIRNASFSVFVSLHEGFGLPVAESLACGTPVITTSYGSQGEIAEGGGCLTVDPRDVNAVAGAMRTLLTQPEVLQRLRSEAASRPGRTWDQYAEELWSYLVEGGRR